VLIDLFLTRTTEHFLNELGRFLFVTPPVAVPPIIPPFSLAIKHRLRPETHIIRLARLQLPSPALQNPDIIASVVDAPSLGGIVESVFNPMRIGHAFDRKEKPRQLQSRPKEARNQEEKTIICRELLGLGWSDLLRIHPRFLGRDFLEQQDVCDLVIGLCSRAALFQGGRRLCEAVGDSAVGSQFGGVEGDVFG
jgi:hypothetical protein